MAALVGESKAWDVVGEGVGAGDRVVAESLDAQPGVGLA